MTKRILFVDDEPNFLSGIRLMLRSLRGEWNLSFANSVDEAIEKARAQSFDMIVSDVTMPVKNGLQLLEELKSDPELEPIPVVILTGNAETDLKRKALDLGATDLLNKPVSAEDLIARIRSVLRLKQYQDDLKQYNATLEERVRERTLELDFSRKDILWRLAKAGEFRDEETGDHVLRVALCSRVLCETIGLPSELTEHVFLASPLHDIGKIGIPDSILLKRGRLTSAERLVMQTHCEIGSSILEQEPKSMEVFMRQHVDEPVEPSPSERDALREIASSIALGHHERWDGEGYPNKIKGEDIPLEARIVAISDVFDALRSERPYKESYSLDRCIEIMEAENAKHFDPNLFEHFLGVQDAFEEIHRQYCN